MHCWPPLQTGVFYLGQFRLSQRPFFYLGQALLGPILLRPSSTLANLFLGPQGWRGEVEQRGGAQRGGAQRGGSPKGWARRVGGAKGGGREGWKGQRVGGPKFRAVFAFPPKISPLFALSGVFSWNCGLCSRPWTSQGVRFGLSGSFLCEPRRPQRREGRGVQEKGFPRERGPRRT